jgi:outer membrane protein assembly factor BamD (BamD/ComL family)
MRIQGWTPLVACALLLAAGCQVPPLPASAQAQAQRRSTEQEPYESGWLWKRLTGQSAAADQAPSAPANSAPVSATPAPAGAAPTAAATAAIPATPASGVPGTGVQPASATTTSGPMLSGETDVRKIGTSLSSAQAAAPAVAEEEEEAPGFDWSSLDPTKVYNKIKDATGFGPDERLAQSYFNEGLALYRQKQFDEAAAKFKSAAGRWPDSTLEEDALFYQAESYFFADRYGYAHDTFLMLFKKYQNTRYLDVAVNRQFAIGRYWEQYDGAQHTWPVTPNFTDKTRPWFDTFGNSVNSYLSVRLNDPTGPLADDSIMATANAYFIRGRYDDAAYHYDLLRKEYPKSEHQVQAHLLGLKSKQMVYQGPMYDSKPLNDADEIARQALTQFRTQLGPEREHLLELRDEIRQQKMERLWAMAQFYETKRAYGAARFYYQDMINQFPQTQAADMARQRLEVIKDFPAQPPDHFKWLTGFFDLIKDW